MGVLDLACLGIARGDLRIYDIAALKAVIEFLPDRVFVIDSKEGGYEGYSVKAWQISRKQKKQALLQIHVGKMGRSKLKTVLS